MENLLRQMRDRKKWTSYEVARRLSIAQSQYYRVENGDASATAEMASAIADLFQVPVDMIFSPSRYVVAAPDSGKTAPTVSPSLPPIENEAPHVRIAEITTGKIFEGPDGNGGSERLQVIAGTPSGYTVKYADGTTRDKTATEIAQWATAQVKTLEKMDPEDQAA